MKKCILLLLCLTPLYAFAGYREVETAISWMYLLLFIWGILNIILFFKIWVATNNIDKLKTTICDKTQITDKSNYLKRLYLLNKSEEAYDFLNERLADEIIAIYTDCKNKSNNEGEIRFGEVLLPMEEIFERRREDIIEKYASDYALFGKSIPAKLKGIKIEELKRNRMNRNIK